MAHFKFDNGYGLSIIPQQIMGMEMLFLKEIAVLSRHSEAQYRDKDGWGLTYATPLTDDVIMGCNEAETMKIMALVKSWPDVDEPDLPALPKDFNNDNKED